MIPWPPPVVPGLTFACCPRCWRWFVTDPACQPGCLADPVTGRLFYATPVTPDPAVTGRVVLVPVCPLCAVRAGPLRAGAGMPPLPAWVAPGPD